MAKTQPQPTNVYAIQHTLDELLDQLNSHPGQPVEWDVLDNDIGGELLSILSKGLYPSPLDCIREYVQNSVDAQAKTVTIRVTGNSVVIHDNGSGMDLTNVVEARKFGISPKSLSLHVGFRGIGIYSGFDICNRLVLTTKKAGDWRSYVLEFDFGLMKSLLDQERQQSQPNRTSLSKLLTDHTRFRMEREDDLNSHYTIVQLEELSGTHIDQLADRSVLRNYILRNLPIDFDDSFAYKEKISRALHENVPGYNAVIIRLESDDAPREIIARPAIPNLDEPKMDFIYSGTGANKKAVAYYWSCLHLGGKKIPDQFSDYSGYIYKVKGFTIGNNRRFEKLFKRGNAGLLWWYTGEIFILDQNVIPNAARDDLEPGSAKSQLESAVQDKLKELERAASNYQIKTRAEKVLMQCTDDLEKIQYRMSSPHYVALDEYTKLGSVIEALTDLRKGPSQKDRLVELLQHAERLRKVAKKAIEAPQDTSARVPVDLPQISTVAPSPVETQTYFEEAQPSEETASDGDGVNQNNSTIPGNDTNREALTSPAFKTLLQVFEASGLSIDQEAVQIIQIIDASLSDVLMRTSDTYVRLLDDIEAKLTTDV